MMKGKGRGDVGVRGRKERGMRGKRRAVFIIGGLLLAGSAVAQIDKEQFYQGLEAQKQGSQLSDKQVSELFKGLAQLERSLLLEDGSMELNQLGQGILEYLAKSDEEGLNPEDYHLSQIEALLKRGAIEERAELEALLYDGLFTYMRDMVEGRPHLKRLDEDWLLEGRQINLTEALGALQERGARYLEELAPKYEQYQLLKGALQRYREASLTAEEEHQVPTTATLRAGDRGEAVALLILRLDELGFLKGPVADNNYFSKEVVAAVKAFQQAHLLEPDGVVGRRTFEELNRTLSERIAQIEINLERWRWMPESLGEHYLVVDIPKYEYAVIKEGEELLRAKTVVGMNRRKTPVFSSEMSYIVFSPYWHVPRSMAVKDQLPKLREDPYRLERSNIRIYDREGNEIDPGMVDWDQYTPNNFPFTLRQDPGAYNSLGQVKFMFPNDYAIYLHDTPQRYLFDKTARTFSSGCIRIENPTELAEYLLEDLGWTRERIERAYGRSSEATVRLSDEMKFPVYTLYMTAEAESGGVVHFRPDIYDKDAILLKALNE